MCLFIQGSTYTARLVIEKLEKVDRDTPLRLTVTNQYTDLWEVEPAEYIITLEMSNS